MPFGVKEQSPVRAMLLNAVDRYFQGERQNKLLASQQANRQAIGQSLSVFQSSLKPGATKEDVADVTGKTVSDLVTRGAEGQAVAKTIVDLYGKLPDTKPAKEAKVPTIQHGTRTVLDEQGNPQYVRDKVSGVSFLKKEQFDLTTGKAIPNSTDLVKMDDSTGASGNGSGNGAQNEQTPEHYYFNYDQSTNEPTSVNFDAFKKEKDPNKVRNRLENTLESQRLQKSRDVTASREALANISFMGDADKTKSAEDMVAKAEQELSHTEKKLKLLRTNAAPVQSGGYADPSKKTSTKPTKGTGAMNKLFTH